jgi:hypothetical protein
MGLTFTPDVSNARKYLWELQGRELPRVIGRTLDGSARFASTRANRVMRERVNLSRAVVSGAIKHRRSSEIQSITALNLGRAWFEVRVSGKPISLRDYAARQTKKGVTFKVSKQGARKRYVRKGQNSFIVNRFGGHVFTRIGADPPGPTTVPIKKAAGPSLPQFFSTKKMQQQVIHPTRDFWIRELQSNIRFAISKRK